MAQSLRAAADHTTRPSPLGSDATNGVAWRQALLGIADWLEHAREVSKLGFSRAATLVAELSARPGDVRDEDNGLGELIWWVADGMQLCPPHEWACPVISKLQPERVAWTCRRCGRTATSPDLKQRPD